MPTLKQKLDLTDLTRDLQEDLIAQGLHENVADKTIDENLSSAIYEIEANLDHLIEDSRDEIVEMVTETVQNIITEIPQADLSEQIDVILKTIETTTIEALKDVMGDCVES